MNALHIFAKHCTVRLLQNMLASAHILSELLKVTLQAVGYVLDTRIFYFLRKTKCSSAHILYELSFFLRDAGATKR